jgi:hypothetical protein
MSTDTPDQQITIPAGTDSADNPVAFTNDVADIEPRLVRLYTNLADRTARMAVLLENNVSGLASENRLDAYDGANHISLHSRALYYNLFRTTDSAAINNSTVLVNDTVLVGALPTAGRFNFDLTLFHDSSATADFKIGFTWPAGATARWGVHSASTAVASGTGTGVWLCAIASGSVLTLGGTGTGTGNTLMSVARGYILMGGTAGNLQLQYAQSVADPTDAVVRTGSRLEIWRVA